MTRRRNQGGQGAMPSKNFLAYLLTFCFERRCPKQNTVARIKSNDLAPQKNLGWLAIGMTVTNCSSC